MTHTYTLRPPGWRWWHRLTHAGPLRLRRIGRIRQALQANGIELTPAEWRLIIRTLLLGGNIHIQDGHHTRVWVSANGEPVGCIVGGLPSDCGFINCDYFPDPGAAA